MKAFLKLKRISFFSALVAVAFLFAAAGADGGTIYTYTTAAGATNSALPVSAKAVITLDANTVTLALTNTLSGDIRSIAEALTGITVTYNGGLAPSSIISSSGEVIYVDSSGGITIENPDPQTLTAKGEWQLSGSLLSVFGGGSPNYSLLDTERPKYADANSSITGNGPHNPYTDGTITFKLNVPGVTTSTTIKSVVFQFGTSTDPISKDNGVPVTNPIPEPASFVLWSVFGLAGLVCRHHRRATRISRQAEFTA